MPTTEIYATARATIHVGRAEEFLPTLATESTDLVVTDPPYGQGYQSAYRVEQFERIEGDTPADRDTVRAVLVECVRLVGQKRHLYVFGPSDVLDGLKVSELTELIWDRGKMTAGDLASTWGRGHEPITFTTSKHRHAGKAGGGSLAVRLRKGSVLRFSPPTGRNLRHPTEKPVALMRELIESSSRVGDLVLDPFLGCGSTAVAAILSGRRFVGCELDPAYAALAAERCAAAEKLADCMDRV